MNELIYKIIKFGFALLLMVFAVTLQGCKEVGRYLLGGIEESALIYEEATQIVNPAQALVRANTTIARTQRVAADATEKFIEATRGRNLWQESGIPEELLLSEEAHVLLAEAALDRGIALEATILAQRRNAMWGMAATGAAGVVAGGAATLAVVHQRDRKKIDCKVLEDQIRMAQGVPDNWEEVQRLAAEFRDKECPLLEEER